MTRFSHVSFWVVVLALALASPALTFGQEVQHEDDYYYATATTTLDARAGGTLNLRTTRGDVVVEAWDNDQVEIRERLRVNDADYDRSTVEDLIGRIQAGAFYATSGSTVRIEELPMRGRPAVERDLQIRVPRSFSLDLQNQAGDLTMRGVRGAAEARTSGGDLEAADIEGDVDLRTSGGDLEVRGVTGAVDARTSGGDMTVGDVGGRTLLRTSGGSIRAERIRGPLDAQTSGGDVEVREATQSVVARTSGGDIELNEIGGALEAQTSGGDIDGQSLRGTVDVRTSAGDIELRAVQGGIRAETSVGDIEVEMVDGGSDYASTIRTSHGDIEIVLPGGLAATIDAEVQSVYGRVDREDIYSDVPLTRESSGASGTLRATGTMNGGGARIELRTNGGSIRIETN